MNLYFSDDMTKPGHRSKIDYPYSYDPILQFKGSSNGKQVSNVWSDRMYTWDYEKFNRCSMEVFGDEGQYFHSRQPKKIEEFLRKYFDQEINLVAVFEHCNQATGYPVWEFQYTKD